MSVDRLSSTASLIAALRGDVLRKMEQRPKAEPSPASQSGRQPPQIAQLRVQLVDIARAADLSDPVQVRQARTRMLRSVLLWEFGDAFRDHPEWRPLMDYLSSALDDDAANARFLQLLQALKGKTKRTSR
ncbi:MAG: hypothetical protein HZT39_02790 [Pseudoxanthomonas sp.]|nr:MAG: hypothetical protein HZT39_02790 [Pseudoxanthomonas sp.]